MKDYKGMIMLFGICRIRKDLAFFQTTSGTPHFDNNRYIKRLEPWLQKLCTIKWIVINIETEKENCLY